MQMSPRSRTTRSRGEQSGAGADRRTMGQVATMDFTLAAPVQTDPDDAINKVQVSLLVQWLKTKAKQYVFQQERGAGGL